MSDHIFSTAMPHALHPNCYLDVLFSDETFPSKGNRYALSTWFDDLVEELLDRDPIDESEVEREKRREKLENRLKKGVPQDFKFDQSIDILKRPIRFRQLDLSHILDRNTTFLLNRIQEWHNTGMIDQIRYRQTKRAVAMTLFSLLEAQLLLERKDDIQTPSRFNFSAKDKLVYDEFRELIAGELRTVLRADATNFPLLKNYDEHFTIDRGVEVNQTGEPLPIRLEGTSKSSFSSTFEKLKNVSKENFSLTENADEFESLKNLISTTEWGYWRPSALLKQHRFAYHQMMTKGCSACDVKKGTPCQMNNLRGHFDRNIGYVNGDVPRILVKSGIAPKLSHIVKKVRGRTDEVRKVTIQTIKSMKKSNLRKLCEEFDIEFKSHHTKRELLFLLMPSIVGEKPVQNFLEHYYKFANRYKGIYGDDEESIEIHKTLITPAQNEKLWEDWDDIHREHALRSTAEGDTLLLPFSCDSRLDIKSHDSSLGAILRGGFFPLTLRLHERNPNEGTIRKYFGGKNPPAMTVQNLWIDLMKRVLSNRSREAKLRDRLGRKEHDDDRSMLLWECLKDEAIETKELDVEKVQRYNDGIRIPLLTLKGESISKSEGCWTWHDKKDWENNKGKLPIVSMNTSTTEIREIFDHKHNKGKLPGLVISIDHWCIEEDNDEVYEPSPLDLHEHYDIRPDRFHENEPANGARTFATFVKRIIETSKYSIARADVHHTRRAYGVLLNPNYERSTG